MDAKQLTDGLKQAFFTEGHRIVFWYDQDQNSLEELPHLDLPEVKILNMEAESTFSLKLHLELDDRTGRYLLYFPCAEPDAADDWLLDIKLYSRCFYADRFSMIFNELGLQQQSLRKHLAERARFLARKTRIAHLKDFIQPVFTETDLDMAMIAVTVGAASPDVASLLFTLGQQFVEEGCDLDQNPSAIAELETFGLVPALLQALRDEVGYTASVGEQSNATPMRFGNLLIRMLATGFCEGIGEIPDWATSIAIPSVNARATSRALLSRWRDSSRFYRAYDEISGLVGNTLRIEERIQAYSPDILANVVTFEAVERRIIVELAHAIPQASSRDLEIFSTTIRSRLDGYWAARHKDDDIRRKYRCIYRALSAAIELFLLRHKHAYGFHYGDCAELYRAYESELYRFDMAYRHYAAASRKAHVEILKKLDEAVEQCYANWYLDQLSRNWSERVEAECRLQDWRISGLPAQQHFFEDTVRKLQDSHRNKRLVVIISDALRYEAAVELCQRINEKRYSEATLTSQLGVLPSYTTLGMAALLPHQTLEYRADGTDTVCVDGQSSQGTGQRNKILGQHGGIAVTADEVKAWSRDEGRERLKDLQLVYVYHNIIDDRSDSGGPSESDTFQHVEEAIEDLNELTRKILMHFNTSTVVITADHGFMFQVSKLEAADRTSLAEKPPNAIKSKKRYVIGPALPVSYEAWYGSTDQTAGTTCDTRFWIPRGANRFHFVGGARFVHGGAMPQEIVVPVITVHQLRGEKVERRSRRKVSVVSPRATLKMVSPIQRFDLMQTEAVSERTLPVTVSVGIYEADRLISSEETLTFDSSSDAISERVKQVRISLAGSDFDRNKEYFLILRDKDNGTELERYKVTIDLAFTDDFF